MELDFASIALLILIALRPPMRSPARWSKCADSQSICLRQAVACSSERKQCGLLERASVKVSDLDYA